MMKFVQLPSGEMPYQLSKSKISSSSNITRGIEGMKMDLQTLRNEQKSFASTLTISLSTAAMGLVKKMEDHIREVEQACGVLQRQTNMVQTTMEKILNGLDICVFVSYEQGDLEPVREWLKEHLREGYSTGLEGLTAHVVIRDPDAAILFKMRWC